MIPQGFGFVKPFLRILFHCEEKGGYQRVFTGLGGGDGAGIRGGFRTGYISMLLKKGFQQISDKFQCVLQKTSSFLRLFSHVRKTVHVLCYPIP